MGGVLSLSLSCLEPGCDFTDSGLSTDAPTTRKPANLAGDWTRWAEMDRAADRHSKPGGHPTRMHAGDDVNDWLTCPNDPKCRHSGVLHDLDVPERLVGGPRYVCTVEACTCTVEACTCGREERACDRPGHADHPARR